MPNNDSTSLADNPAIRVSMAAEDVALITMDLPGTGANILNDQLFAELDQTMAELAERKDLAGVILYSAKPSIFVAGADLNNIVANLDWPDQEIIKFCEKGRAVMARFSRCPFVSVAAIHGACVGGGLELALWCDCRIVSDHRRTLLGLPEVKLGLVPGWAGTARLPRIAGLAVAADLVTSGRLVGADEALKMNFVDQVVAQEDLLPSAIEMIQRVRTSEKFIHDRKAIMGPVPGIDPEQPNSAIELVKQVVTEAGEKIVNNQDVFPYAPTVVLEHMTRTSAVGIKEAWDSESIAMAQVWGSPASRGLLHHFFLVDRNKKNPGLVDLSLETPTIQNVAIIGAGLMGRAIAANCLKAGLNVQLMDADQGVAREVVRELEKDSTNGSISQINRYDQLSNADLVIESVVETHDVKSLVLQQIEQAVSDSTLIATNTSAIPIGKLATCLQHPGRFCGIHFCHPDLMSLVEVVCGQDSIESTIASAVRFVQQLRKMPVAINDGPGFVVNRLLATMLNQAFDLFTKGVEIKQIDHAMREFGFLGGPFEIIDVVGVDTCTYAGRTMWEAGLDCVSLSPILPRLMKAGRLGRKTGAGFYRYDSSPGAALPDPELAALIESYRDAPDQRVEKTDDKVIVKQIVRAMAAEADKILEEEIVADPRDIDLCVVHGFSFPKHQGGVLFYRDHLA